MREQEGGGNTADAVTAPQPEDRGSSAEAMEEDGRAIRPHH